MSEVKNKGGQIEGVLVYAKIAEADTKYQSKDKEYSIQIIVDEDAADAWDEVFTKQTAKKIKVSEFKTKFKFDLPERFEGQKNVYSITLRKDAVVNGEEIFPQYRPRVFLDDGEGNLTDITESRLIANGSYGAVSYRQSTNDYGTFARLNNVKILENDFIEYESASVPAGQEFGGKVVKKEESRKEATQARASKEAKEDKEPKKATPSKPAKPTKPVDDDVVGEDIPF